MLQYWFYIIYHVLNILTTNLPANKALKFNKICFFVIYHKKLISQGLEHILELPFFHPQNSNSLNILCLQRGDYCLTYVLCFFKRSHNHSLHLKYAHPHESETT